MTIRRLQGLGIAQGYLVLAQPRRPLARLDGNSGRGDLPADLPNEVFIIPRTQNMVVHRVRGGGMQPVITGAVYCLVAVVKQVKLKLRGGHGNKTLLPALLMKVLLEGGVVVGGLVSSSFKLGFEHPPGALGYFLPLPVDQVADDQGCRRAPGRDSNAGRVGGDSKIAVTLFPTTHSIAVLGLHFDIRGQQIAAAFYSAVFQIVLAGNALSHQLAELIGKGDNYSIDRAIPDALPQLLGIYPAGGITHRRLPTANLNRRVCPW